MSRHCFHEDQKEILGEGRSGLRSDRNVGGMDTFVAPAFTGKGLFEIEDPGTQGLPGGRKWHDLQVSHSIFAAFTLSKLCQSRW
jgi:hypothetical protein